MTLAKAEQITGLHIQVFLRTGPRGGKTFRALARSTKEVVFGHGRTESQAISALVKAWEMMRPQ